MNIMPFGKYKGRCLTKVPKGYLQWLLTNCDIQGDLLEAIRAVIHNKPIPPTQAERDSEMYRKVDELFGQ